MIRFMLAMVMCACVNMVHASDSNNPPPCEEEWKCTALPALGVIPPNGPAKVCPDKEQSWAISDYIIPGVKTRCDETAPVGATTPIWSWTASGPDGSQSGAGKTAKYKGKKDGPISINWMGMAEANDPCSGSLVQSCSFSAQVVKIPLQLTTPATTMCPDEEKDIELSVSNLSECDDYVVVWIEPSTQDEGRIRVSSTHENKVAAGATWTFKVNTLTGKEVVRGAYTFVVKATGHNSSTTSEWIVTVKDNEFNVDGGEKVKLKVGQNKIAEFTLTKIESCDGKPLNIHWKVEKQGDPNIVFDVPEGDVTVDGPVKVFVPFKVPSPSDWGDAVITLTGVDQKTGAVKTGSVQVRVVPNVLITAIDGKIVAGGVSNNTDQTSIVVELRDTAKPYEATLIIEEGLGAKEKRILKVGPYEYVLGGDLPARYSGLCELKAGAGAVNVVIPPGINSGFLYSSNLIDDKAAIVIESEDYTWKTQSVQFIAPTMKVQIDPMASDGSDDAQFIGKCFSVKGTLVGPNGLVVVDHNSILLADTVSGEDGSMKKLDADGDREVSGAELAAFEGYVLVGPINADLTDGEGKLIRNSMTTNAAVRNVTYRLVDLMSIKPMP